jgi:hypothetical protein
VSPGAPGQRRRARGFGCCRGGLAQAVKSCESVPTAVRGKCVATQLAHAGPSRRGNSERGATEGPQRAARATTFATWHSHTFSANELSLFLSHRVLETLRFSIFHHQKPIQFCIGPARHQSSRRIRPDIAASLRLALAVGRPRMRSETTRRAWVIPSREPMTCRPTCPVSTGEGRGLSSKYEGRDEACPVSTGGRGGAARAVTSQGLRTRGCGHDAEERDSTGEREEEKEGQRDFWGRRRIKSLFILYPALSSSHILG